MPDEKNTIKHFFEIRDFVDIFQIILIFSLGLFNVFLLFIVAVFCFCVFVIPYMISGCHDFPINDIKKTVSSPVPAHKRHAEFPSVTNPDFQEYRSSYKKATAMLNQVLTLQYALEGEVPTGNENDFAKMLVTRMNVTDAWGIEGLDDYPKKSFIDYNINAAPNQKGVLLADGMGVFVSKFTPGCKVVDTENINNSDCIVDVYTKFYKNRLEMTKDCHQPKSGIRLIIDGNGPRAVLPEMYKPCVYDEYSGR